MAPSYSDWTSQSWKVTTPGFPDPTDACVLSFGGVAGNPTLQCTCTAAGHKCSINSSTLSAYNSSNDSMPATIGGFSYMVQHSAGKPDQLTGNPFSETIMPAPGSWTATDG